MPTKNDITGDSLISKTSNDAYRDGWERIFGNKSPSLIPSAESHVGTSERKEPSETSDNDGVEVLEHTGVTGDRESDNSDHREDGTKN